MPRLSKSSNTKINSFLFLPDPTSFFTGQNPIGLKERADSIPAYTAEATSEDGSTAAVIFENALTILKYFLLTKKHRQIC